MNLFPFFNTSRLKNEDIMITIIIMMIIFGTIVFTIIVGILINNKNKAILKEKDGVNNSYSNCILNLKSQTIKINKLNCLEEIQNIPIFDFLIKFDIKDQNDIKLWFESLIIEKEVDENKKVFIANEIKEYKQGKYLKYTRVIFNVNQIDRNKGLIYFIKEDLKNIPYQIVNKKIRGIKKSKKGHPVFYGYKEIKTLFESGAFLKGSAYFLSFQLKKDNFCGFNEKYIFYKIIDRFFKTYDESDVYILLNEENPLEILIFDSKFYTESQLNRKIEYIYNKILAICEVNSFSRFYTLVCTACKCSDLPNGFEKSYDLIKRFCINLIEEKKSYEYLDARSNDFKALQDSYSEEVSKIIRNSLIDIYFDPIIKISKNKIYISGYNYTPVVRDTSFKNYKEFKKYANKFDLRKDCFSLVIKKTINNFIAQKDNPNLRLFSLIDLQDVPYANRIFPHLSNLKECNLVLTFKNNEFIDFEDDQEYIRVVKTAQSKGYDCALYINLNDYSLKDSTYKLFNYFLFNFENYKDLKSNSIDFLRIHSLLEKFVKFDRPIMCVNVHNWTIIELLIRSGITYFSSPNVFQTSTLLSPIDKKVTRKFQNIIKE